jgi:hypothetical protein
VSNSAENRRYFQETLAYTYLYVSWRGAVASAAEVAALQRIDPRLRHESLGANAARLAEGDVWRLGPSVDMSEANTIQAQLQAEGFRVERKPQ